MEYDDDEEGEIMPECVADYYFVENDTPVSFASLPVVWHEDETPSVSENQKVFLCGTWDDGLQKIYKRVIAWKFNLSTEQPEICVLTNETRIWIMLKKCRKSFEDIIRTILVTLHWLHHLKKLSSTSADKSPWKYLSSIFSTHDVKPSEKDLFDHIQLIREAAKRDKDLASSKYLLAFSKSPGTSITFHEDVHMAKKTDFIDDRIEYEEDDPSEDEMEESFYDSVCAICDNGGIILSCEGKCLRSFHPTIDSGVDTRCESLGFANDAEYEAIPVFLCKNCRHKKHQCFACGKLGSSDESSGEEVFRCISATCGHFYHPECVAKLLHPNCRTQVEEARESIAARNPFTCPAHKCQVCKEEEDKNVTDLQFAICRRCPNAYHKKCLPRAIRSPSENEYQRAWTDLLPNRILIYCLSHEIDRNLNTPSRDHLIFPRLKIRIQKQKVVAANSVGVCEMGTTREKLKIVQNARSAAEVQGSDMIEKTSPKQYFDPSRRPTVFGLAAQSSTNKNQVTVSNRPSINIGSYSYPPKPKQQSISHRKIENVVPVKLKKKVHDSEPVDPEIKNSILALMRDSTASFDVEEFMSRQKIPSTCSGSSKIFLDKTVTLGFVEGAVKAVRTASKMLDKGGSIRDAKTVCPPELLTQLHTWKRKLKVYLAPFIHGARYTSFGRHFTKKDKLEEIVDRLHSYVQNGDTIVDFCCGTNDFSSLMKEKLETVGKSCSFKNFDLIPPKNDFCFEKRDWMSIKLDELPNGSQLIIGLNPPFGVKASLANKFIDKALKFRPKLIVLIVPRETKRINEKASYDLVWEDCKLLAGKSFYLPGSAHVNDNQLEQWNLVAPPLYLWSRSDFTVMHKSMALKFSHIFEEQAKMQGNSSCSFSNLFAGATEKVKRHKGLTNNDKQAAQCHFPSSSGCVDMEISPVGSPEPGITPGSYPTEAHKGYESVDLGDEVMDGYYRQLRSPDSQFRMFGSLPPPPPLPRGSLPPERAFSPGFLPPPPPLYPGSMPPERAFSPGSLLPPPPPLYPGSLSPERTFSPGSLPSPSLSPGSLPPSPPLFPDSPPPAPPRSSDSPPSPPPFSPGSPPSPPPLPPSSPPLLPPPLYPASLPPISQLSLGPLLPTPPLYPGFRPPPLPLGPPLLPTSPTHPGSRSPPLFLYKPPPRFFYLGSNPPPQFLFPDSQPSPP